MTFYFNRGCASAALLLVLCVCATGSGQEPSSESDRPAWQPEIPIEVAEDTTVLTQPLLEDGTVDYFSVVNERFGQGVTPENNAMVGYVRAFGPPPFPESFLRKYFAALGIEPLPEEGHYVLGSYNYIQSLELSGEELEEVRAQFDAVVNDTQPCWLPEAYPHVAVWIHENDAALEEIVTASRLPHCYGPLVVNDYWESDANALGYAETLPYGAIVRNSMSALTTRARMKAGEGDIAGALADLAAARRFARHLGATPFVINSLVSTGLESKVLESQQAVFSEASLTLEQVRKYRQQLEELPARRALSEILDYEDRYYALDCFVRMSRDGPRVLQFHGARRSPSRQLSLSWDTTFQQADWNRVLRQVNGYHDRFVAAISLEDYQQAKEELQRIDDQVRDLNQAMRSGFWTPFWSRPYEEVLADGIVAAFLDTQGAAMHYLEYKAHNQANERLSLLAGALAEYKLTEGNYPEQLAGLVPHYLAEVPSDPFTGNAFVYCLTDDGYLLYSLGRNETDDGGVATLGGGVPGDMVFQVHQDE